MTPFEIATLAELLDELEDYFDGKADAEIIDGRTHPNKEMRLLYAVREQIAALTPKAPTHCPACGRAANAAGGTEECRLGGCGLGGDF